MKIYIGPYKKDDSNRKVRIRIDKYDTWNMDHTLALIILPMLKQLKDSGHSSPGTMSAFHQTSHFNRQYCFDFYSDGDELADEIGHVQWAEILDKIIWSFEQIIEDDDSKFWIKSPEIDWNTSLSETLNSDAKIGKLLKWKDVGVFDFKAHAEYHTKVQEGLFLFGKYYENLWD